MKNIELAITMAVMELNVCTQQELSKRFWIRTLSRYIPWLVNDRVLHTWNKGYSRDGVMGYVKIYEIHNEYRQKFKEKYLLNEAIWMDKLEQEMVVKFHSAYPAHFNVNGKTYEYVPWWGLLSQGNKVMTHKEWTKYIKKIKKNESPSKSKEIRIRWIEDPELRNEIKWIAEEL